MSAQLRDFCVEVDRRLGSAAAPELLSVSQSRGVVPRSSITEKEPRADDFAKYKVCEADDLVLNRFNAYRGSLGRSDSTGIVSPDYLVLRPTLGDSKFLSYLLRSTDIANEMKAAMSGLGASDPDASGFSRIDVRSLMRTCILGIPRDEQRQIAGYLDRETGQIDALIAKQEQLVETLTERRQAVIAQAVTGGLDPNVDLKDSGVEWLGRVPKHWGVSPIKWIAVLRTGGTPKVAVATEEQEGPSWFRPEDLDGSGCPSSSSKRLSEDGAAELRGFAAGSTLICAIGASLGKVGIVDHAAFCNQQITAVQTNLSDRFAFYSLSTAREAIVALSVGNTIPIINNDRLGMLPMPSPSLHEQNAISEYLDRESAKINSLSAKARQIVDVLKERRQALISAAVTGKIDVRGL